ncbi:hypothetical protein COBT_004211, partial [Conglomerata obtusa]
KGNIEIRKNLLVAELNNKILHLFMYFGYDFFLNEEIRIYLMDINININIDQYLYIFTDENKHTLYLDIMNEFKLKLQKIKM